MTVSVVLNGARSATRVSDATRARIKEAAARLSYQPNAVARGLTRRRMDTIGVVALVQGGDVNLYFLEVIGSIIEAANEHKQNTTIFSIDEWSRDQSRILQFCDGRVDGMILVAPMDVSETVADSLRRRTPFVMLHSDAGALAVDNIDVDNVGGSYAMVQYLTSIGHKRIAHFAGPTTRVGALRRLDGYRRALEDAGIEYDASLVSHGPYAASTGRELAQILLDRCAPQELPTAIFCATDAIAFGCMEVLNRNGIRIPDDISVAAFDGLLQSLMTVPPLTTVHQPLHRMGRYAVERLLKRIDEGVRQPVAASAASGDGAPVGAANGNGYQFKDGNFSVAGRFVEPPRTDIFACELIIRGSTGPPRSA